MYIHISLWVFVKKFMYLKSINKGRMTTTYGVYASLDANSPFSSHYFLVNNLKRRSKCLENVWIPLEARHLNNFKEHV